jgi:hypothetical protein
MNQPALPVPSDSSGLDIDDPTATKFEGVARIIRAVDAFIQAYRSSQLLLKASVIDDVVRSQGLLN